MGWTIFVRLFITSVGWDLFEISKNLLYSYVKFFMLQLHKT